jgi:tetratricopeptide (TPR) repeat protein
LLTFGDASSSVVERIYILFANRPTTFSQLNVWSLFFVSVVSVMSRAISRNQKSFQIILACLFGFAVLSIDQSCQARDASHSHPDLGAKEKLELGQMLLYNANPQAAAVAFEDAVRMDPDLLQAYVQLVAIYGRLHDANKQVRALKEIVRLQPDDFDTRLELANALIAGGRFEEAIDQLKHCLPVAKNPEAVKLTLAFALLDNGNFAESNALFEELPQKMTDVSVMLAQSMCNLKLGKLEEADKLIDRAIKSRSPNPEGHCLRGDLKYAQGKKQEAIEEYLIAAKEAPDQGQAYQSLGDLYLREQDFLSSRQAYLKANKLKQRNADILCGLALTYEKLGDARSAAIIYNEALKYENKEDRQRTIRDHIAELGVAAPKRLGEQNVLIR